MYRIRVTIAYMYRIRVTLAYVYIIQGNYSLHVQNTG